MPYIEGIKNFSAITREASPYFGDVLLIFNFIINHSFSNIRFLFFGMILSESLQIIFLSFYLFVELANVFA